MSAATAGVVRRDGARELSPARCPDRRSRTDRRGCTITLRVYELTELLVDQMGLADLGAVFPHRVTYHPTCHGLRMLGLDDKPLRLLRAVRGLDLVELPQAQECCGFGGTFAVKNADTSTAMLSDKVASILRTEAKICTGRRTRV